jgi:hypothetical protein
METDYKFAVRDLVLNKIVEHPTVWDGIETLTIVEPERASFAIDQSGELLIIDLCGNYVYATNRYKVEYPAGA